MDVVSYLAFFALGLALGYGLQGPWAFLAFLAPVLLYIAALLTEGFDGGALLELVLALVVVLAGIVAGRLLAERTGGEDAAAVRGRAPDSARRSGA